MTGECLHKAILLNEIKDVETILDSPDALRVIELPDKIGNTPLMCAIIADNLDIVELLVLKGADVNTQNESGKSALMFGNSKHTKHLFKVKF